MYFDIALRKDLNGDVKSAINVYRKSVENEEMNLESHLNLIVILIEITFDHGVGSDLINKKVYDQGELNTLYQYLETLINKTELVFDSNEVFFWKYYKEKFYEEFNRDKLIEIINIDKDSLIPYFQLYILDLENNSSPELYQHKIVELKQKLERQDTFKNRYIKSLIQSAENLQNLY